MVGNGRRGPPAMGEEAHLHAVPCDGLQGGIVPQCLNLILLGGGQMKMQQGEWECV